MNLGGSFSRKIQRVRENTSFEEQDFISIEEPLEIRLGFDDPTGMRVQKTISITMRTPGHDKELAAGFLFTEGIVLNRSDIDDFKSCGPKINGTPFQNVIRVELKPNLPIDLKKLERHFYT